jgi:hypothetical protein
MFGALNLRFCYLLCSRVYIAYYTVRAGDSNHSLWQTGCGYTGISCHGQLNRSASRCAHSNTRLRSADLLPISIPPISHETGFTVRGNLISLLSVVELTWWSWTSDSFWKPRTVVDLKIREVYLHQATDPVHQQMAASSILIPDLLVKDATTQNFSLTIMVPTLSRIVRSTPKIRAGIY